MMHNLNKSKISRFGLMEQRPSKTKKCWLMLQMSCSAKEKCVPVGIFLRNIMAKAIVIRILPEFPIFCADIKMAEPRFLTRNN
jgi:hypothetical protein